MPNYVANMRVIHGFILGIQLWLAILHFLCVSRTFSDITHQAVRIMNTDNHHSQALGLWKEHTSAQREEPTSPLNVCWPQRIQSTM